MIFALSLFFTTFVFEDVALLSSIGMRAQGKISFSTALWACFLGISIGNLLLYLIGRLATNEKWELRYPRLVKYRTRLEKIVDENWLSYSIVVSRVIPGTRIPTYLGAGYLKYSFWQFLSLTILSVFAWVWLALWGGSALNNVFAEHWAIGLGIIIVLFYFLKWMTPIVRSWVSRYRQAD